MTLSDLFFLVSVLFVVTLCVRIAVSALQRRWETSRRLGRILGWFVAFYAATLICTALALPRRVYAPGERRCFDDWCVAAIDAKIADGSSAPCQADHGGRNWIAAIKVSSDAKRIRQRAPDARAELEDGQGRRYQPCAAALPGGTGGRARLLSDKLGPGESFDVFLPFHLPSDKTPAGLVVHHGDIPGVVIVGADQSLLHRPALLRFAVEQPR